MKKFFTIQTAILMFLFPAITYANTISSGTSNNDTLLQQTGTQISEVLNPWIAIACSSMILSIIAGAGIIILGSGNPQMRSAGKSLVIGSGVTITLLLSAYAITDLFLSIFGLSLFNLF